MKYAFTIRSLRLCILFWTAVLVFFLAVASSQCHAQASKRSGSEKVDAAAKPAAAPKTGDKAATKPKAAVPPPVKDATEKAVAPAKPAGADEKAKDYKDAEHEAVDYTALLFVFVMATIIGLGVVARVSRLLHTPLMSLTNAISAIAIVGAIFVTGSSKDVPIKILGAIAIFASMTNVVSGFLITDRMLKMFKQTRTEKK